MKRNIGAIWGVGGVILLLTSAIVRLTPIGLQAFTLKLTWYHYMSLALILVAMAYYEGYRSFQCGFAPRVAARARYLAQHPTWGKVLAAPLFCMGYFYATRKRRIVSFSVTGGIIVLIVLVRLLVQPWRGLIDLGVVLGLGWGIIALLAFSFKAWRHGEFPVSPDVPPLAG